MKGRFRFLRPVRPVGEAGDVLLEYVVVCGAIGIALVLFMQGQFFNFDKGYVGLGLEILKANQRVLGGVALPVP